MRVTVKEPHPFPSLCLLAKNRFLSLLLPQCLTDVFLQHSHSKKSQCLQLNLARPDKRHKAACWGWSMKNLLVVRHCRLCWQVTEIHGLVLEKGSWGKPLLCFLYICTCCNQPGTLHVRDTARGMAVNRSITLVQTEIFKQLQNGLP